jgi:TRAP-type C4-dicarboxylate transport system substrate-binding protein
VGRLVVSREPVRVVARRSCRPEGQVSTIINKNAVAEREEIARQNTALKSDLAAKGLIFNDVDPAPFRETPSKSGFYAEWKGKFGEAAWALLEEST